MKPRLLDLVGAQIDGERARRRSARGGALAVIPSDRCPACGRVTEADVVEQPALLRHGGHGATRRTRIRRCECGWRLVAEITEVRP